MLHVMCSNGLTVMIHSHRLHFSCCFYACMLTTVKDVFSFHWFVIKILVQLSPISLDFYLLFFRSSFLQRLFGCSLVIDLHEQLCIFSDHVSPLILSSQIWHEL